MTQPAYVSRADAAATIITQYSREIIAVAAQQSVAMRTFRQMPMGSKTLQMALLDTFPSAQWLLPAMSAPVSPTDVDVALKPMTDMTWVPQSITAEEAATIVAIPENVIDDAEVDLWAEIETRTAEAIARLIDKTVFFGEDTLGGTAIPASFPLGGIHGRAVAAGNEYISPVAPGNVDAVEGWNQAMALVEADGFNVTNSYAATSLKAKLRGMRDSTGAPVYATDFVNGVPADSVYGVPVGFMLPGTWNATKSAAIMGDPRFAILGIRQRLTATRLTEATVGTGTAAPLNLAERDMVALRVKIRLAFGIVAPKQPGIAAPFPFATLSPTNLK